MLTKITKFSLPLVLFAWVLSKGGMLLYPYAVQGPVGGPKVFQRIEAPVRERLIEINRKKLLRVKKIKERFQFNISQGATFEDNLFLAHEGRESDLKFDTELGLRLVLIPRRIAGRRSLFGLSVLGFNGLIANYRMNREIYAKHSKLNSTNHFIGLEGGLEPHIFGKKLKLAVDARQTPEIFLVKNQASTGEEKKKRTQYFLSAKASYPWSEKTEGVLQYSAQALRYEGKFQNLNSLTHSWEPSFTFRWRPKTEFAVSGRLAPTQYEERKNNSRDSSIRFIVLKQLGSRTGIKMDLGYGMIQKVNAGSTSKSLIFNASFLHTLNDRLRLGITASRQLQESLLQSSEDSVTSSTSSTRQLKEAVEDENPIVITHSLGTNLDYRLTPKLTFSPRVALVYDQERGSRSNRFLISLQLAIKYAINRSWIFESGYTLNVLNSNENTTDYKDNLLFARLGYSFGSKTSGH